MPTKIEQRLTALEQAQRTQRDVSAVVSVIGLDEAEAVRLIDAKLRELASSHVRLVVVDM